MKSSTLVTSALLLATGSLWTTGCVYRERTVYRDRGPAPAVAYTPGTEVIATEAPPPDEVETVTVSPGPGFVWIGGAWMWHRNHWAWEHGRWGRPPRAGVVWVPHRYVYRNGVHVFVRGGWR